MKAAESAFPHPPRHSTRPEPGRGQVRRCHDAMPARGEGGNRPIWVHNSPIDAGCIGLW